MKLKILVIFVLINLAICCYSPYTIIKHRATGLVLTVEEETIVARNLTSRWNQKWKLVSTCDGSFRIECSNRALALSENTIILSYYQYGKILVSWYINSDGRITNTINTNLTLTVNSTNHLIITEIDNSDNQRFELSCSSCSFCC